MMPTDSRQPSVGTSAEPGASGQPPWVRAAAEEPSKRSGCVGPFLGCLIGIGGMALVVAALFVVFGLNVFIGQAEEALRANPVIAKALGELETVDMLWLETMNHGGMNTFVFRLEGSLASGKVEAELITVDAETEAVGGGVLYLDSGDVLDLMPEDRDQPVTGAEEDGEDERADG